MYRGVWRSKKCKLCGCWGGRVVRWDLLLFCGQTLLKSFKQNTHLLFWNRCVFRVLNWCCEGCVGACLIWCIVVVAMVSALKPPLHPSPTNTLLYYTEKHILKANFLSYWAFFWGMGVGTFTCTTHPFMHTHLCSHFHSTLTHTLLQLHNIHFHNTHTIIHNTHFHNTHTIIQNSHAFTPTTCYIFTHCIHTTVSH